MQLKNNKEELLKLTLDAQHYLQSQIENTSYFVDEIVRVPSKLSKSSPILPPIPKPVNVPKPEEKVSLPEEKIIVSQPVETTRLDEMKLLFKKHHQSQFRNEIPVFVKLLTTNETSLPFLQKLELAINEAFLPSKAYFCQNEKEIRAHLTSHSLKFFLAPLDEFHSFTNCDEAEIHELTKIDKTVYWMPLHLCANYLKDPGLKRSLWNKLKSLSFADLLA